MGIARKINIVDLTPEEVAQEFCLLDSEQQARFFNTAAEIMGSWADDVNYEFQLQAIAKERSLNHNGHGLMIKIGESANVNLNS